MNSENPTYPVDDPSWCTKGAFQLVPGDIVRIVDHPTVKDPDRKTVRGSYLPVKGADGKPVYGTRRTVGTVCGLSPSLSHPKARIVAGMCDGFYREIYVEALTSEGLDAVETGTVISFLQHNAACQTREVLRWPLSGPNWPATSTMTDRNAEVLAFEETARSQRVAIDGWLPLRTKLEELAALDGRKAKQLLEELAPDDVIEDPCSTQIWVGKLWSGQQPLTPDLRTSLARLVHRLDNRTDEDQAARGA